MAEVQPSRPATRGRGSSRGRGGYSSRGGARQTSKQTNGDAGASSDQMSLEDQGELGLLKKKYQSELPLLKDVFADWTDEDLVFALQESNGDVQSTIEKIAEGKSASPWGNVSQFTDVKKKPREKSRAKAANDAFFLAPGDAETKNPTARAGRGRGGAEGVRGGRGRGSDRGRGGARGGRGGSGAATNGSRSTAPEVTATSTEASGGWDTQPSNTEVTGGWGDAPPEAAAATSSWDDAAPAHDSTATDAWGTDTAPDNAPANAPQSQKSSLIPAGTTKSWASAIGKPQVAPAARKPATPAAMVAQPQQQPTAEESMPTNSNAFGASGADAFASEPTEDSWDASNQPSRAVDDGFSASGPATADVTPTKDALTEDNVEHIPDASGPQPTETTASTRGADDRSAIGPSTPSFAASQQAPIGRPSLGGFATSAHKAANMSGRSMSYQRLKEQQDAVVMPGNHAVDRATVQFGQMGLGSTGSGGPQDVDDEREDAETRAQPPQQSPSQPRASLPPAPRPYQMSSEHPPQEGIPTPRQAPGLPMPGQHQSSMAGQPSQAPGAPGLGHSGADSQQYGSYGRYGGNAFGQDQGAPPQKEYDPFSSQLNAPSHSEQRNAYGGLSQAPAQSSQPTQSYSSGYSQAQGEYGSQYGNEQSQGGYQNYYGSYGQPATSSMPENVAPQRTTSGFSTQDARYGSSQHQPSQSHFTEGQASGNNTPNPTMTSQHGAGAHNPQSQHMQSHGQSGYGGGHYGGGGGYNNYYGGGYNQHYPQSYGNQQYGYGQGGYGSGGYGGNKGGMYGGNSAASHGYHGYGSGSYEQSSSSPATTGAFGQGGPGGRESSMSSNLNDYNTGPSGSTQPTSQHPSSSTPGTGFGSMADTSAAASYGRSASGFGSHANAQNYSHNQGYGAGNETSSAHPDTLKSLHDPSKTSGAGGRPGSAFNSHAGYGPQSGGQGAGAGPGQLSQMHSQYGNSGYGGGAAGIGGLSGHGSHGASSHQHGHHQQSAGYGGYGGAAAGGAGSAGGFGGQRGGWGQYGGGGQGYGH